MALCLMVALSFAGCKSAEEKRVSVQSVSMLMGTDTGLISRYSGIVVSQNETKVEKDETKTIDEILVEEGQTVQAGEALFTYDKEELDLTIQKAELELEQLNNQIKAYKDQITQLEKDKAKASSSDKLAYTVQIQEAQLNQKEAEYNVKVKKTEIENLKKSLESNEVTSPITGRVQTINENGGTDNYGNALPFMTIVESGTYRVKGTINENNRMELMEGMPVIVRARNDLSQYWTGTIEIINWDDPITNNNNGMFYDSGNDEMASSSSYPFYIPLDDIEGMIIGQHVYIEANYGQEEEEGIWLNDGYIVTDGEETYVWATDSSSKLEKRNVTIGEHDEAQGKTEITAGLTGDDYIAWPEEALQVGMSVVYYDEESFEVATTGGEEFDDGMDDGMYEDGEGFDDGMMGGEGFDDGMYEDGGEGFDEGMFEDGMPGEGETMPEDMDLGEEDSGETTTFEKIRLDGPEG